MKKLLLSFLAAAALGASASAQGLQITEWMYSGNSGEYIEFTNTGATAVDFTGWSFDDDSNVAGSFSLSAFGLVNPGESVILTEIAAATFRTNWGLAASVKVIGSNNQNLGRNDQINLYNAATTLVDRLNFGDETYASTVRTQNKSASVPVAGQGLTTVSTSWTLAVNGDAFGSWTSAQGDVGNPGQYLAAIPEPSTYAALVAGLVFGAVAWQRRRRTMTPATAVAL